MNKDIFVWKSYGDVIPNPKGWGFRKAFGNSVIECIDKVGGVCCHETFEYGTGFTKLK